MVATRHHLPPGVTTDAANPAAAKVKVHPSPPPGAYSRAGRQTQPSVEFHLMGAVGVVQTGHRSPKSRVAGANPEIQQIMRLGLLLKVRSLGSSIVHFLAVRVIDELKSLALVLQANFV